MELNDGTRVMQINWRGSEVHVYASGEDADWMLSRLDFNELLRRRKGTPIAAHTSTNGGSEFPDTPGGKVRPSRGGGSIAQAMSGDAAKQ